MAEIWVYDVIGEGFLTGGVTAKDIRDELAELDKDEPVLLRINSPGGNAFEAVAMHTMLSQWPGGVDVQVDGVAASAASFLAMAASGEIRIADGAMMMIHDPWTLAIGNAEDMRETAGVLDKLGDNIASLYAGRTGKSVSAVRGVMRAETWFTASEAIDFGLATNVAEVAVAAFAIPKEFGYKNAPLRQEKPKKQQKIDLPELTAAAFGRHENLQTGQKDTKCPEVHSRSRKALQRRLDFLRAQYHNLSDK